MKSPAQRSVETRRLYNFEVKVFSESGLAKLMPISYLRAWVDEIWFDQRMIKPKPVTVAGKGIRRLVNGELCVSSFYSVNQHKIVLAPSQRNMWILLHELTHAFGYDYHDQRFVRKYFELLAKYGECDKDELLQQARLLKVTV